MLKRRSREDTLKQIEELVGEAKNKHKIDFSHPRLKLVIDWYLSEYSEAYLPDVFYEQDAFTFAWSKGKRSISIRILVDSPDFKVELTEGTEYKSTRRHFKRENFVDLFQTAYSIVR